jgi:hypothetical protein
LTDLLKEEVVTDGKGNHFRFVGTCQNLEETKILCQQLEDQGYASAYNQRSDNQIFEIMTKFSVAEEICFLFEEQHCAKCHEEKKTKCSPQTCAIKKDMEDKLWKEKMGFVNLLKHDLKKLRAATAMQ